jgi:hypothetical protein
MWRFVTLLLLPFLFIDVIIAADPCPCYSSTNPENATINSASDRKYPTNPQYPNKTACAADCTYNIQTSYAAGLALTMVYCTPFPPGTVIIVKDGCSSWNISSCAAGTYVNGTCGQSLVIALTETSPSTYYLQVDAAPISIQTTTVKPTTVQQWTGTGNNPTVMRMDIAIGVDFYATDANFYPTLVNFLNSTFSQFNFGTDPATPNNRLSWFFINPGSGGISDSPWEIDNIATLIKKLDALYIWTAGGPSNYTTIATKFIEQSFNNNATDPKSARPNTQKVLLLFTSSDAGDAGFGNLPVDLKTHDLHTIIVNMAGKPLTKLETLISVTPDSNVVQEYNYTLNGDLETNVKNFINFLYDGNGLCGVRSYDPIPNPTPGTVVFNIPPVDQPTINGRVQPKLYCNNMNYQYAYNTTLTSGSTIINFPIFDLALDQDYLHVTNGGNSVASLTGQLYNPYLCIDNPASGYSTIGFIFESHNGKVYSGVQVNVTTTTRSCTNPTFKTRK